MSKRAIVMVIRESSLVAGDLEREGHCVRVCKTPLALIHELERHGADLVVLEHDPPALADFLRETYPQVRLLVPADRQKTQQTRPVAA